MRTVECNTCGEPLTGENDEALCRRLRDHVSSAHPEAEMSEEDARSQVSAEAYTASDN
jgi:predicted small metal-binding protein